MRVDLRNAEQYLDPTAFAAMKNIEKEEKSLFAFRPIVYICSPYAGDVETNIKAAQRYSRFAVDTGYLPIAPHLLFPQFMNDSNPKERDLAMFMNLVFLSKCAELWVFGSKVTEGMAVEIKTAKQKRMTIRYFKETKND